MSSNRLASKPLSRASPCVFGMEATGHYWYPIYSFLKAKGYTIYVINPIQSDSL